MIPMIAAALSLAAPFELQNGDRVLFYGDSITEQRLYTTYVEAFVKTRYPHLKIDFISCGVGGDATWGGWTAAPDERVRRDVKPENPTIVTIMLGMNDGGYVPFDPKIFATFQEWYGKLLGWMGEGVPKAKITLMDSPPYDDWAHPNTDFKGYSDTVRRFAEYVPKLAEERKLGFVSINAKVTEFIKWALAKDAKKATSIAPDAIHPGPEGHLVIASQLLRKWNASPVVSTVLIDAADGKVIQTENCKVEKLSGLAWIQTDQALPYPLDPNFTQASAFLDFHQNFNRQMLTVNRLPAGTYRLEIDGEKITEAPAADWEKGINLAPLSTPMRKQAQRVMGLTVQRNDAHFLRWRNLDFQLKEFSTTPAASAALRKVEAEIAKAQVSAAQPRPHQFKLVRSS